MITSLGDSGLPVFQAGHWDWQRPHSVQEVKSSKPFQVKSSILPTPSGASSSSSSIAVRSSGLPPIMIGCNAPSAGPPEASRLNQMLGQTVKRCQATPMVVLSPITMNHAIEMMILTAEITTMAVSKIGAGMPAGSTNQVSGKCSREARSPSSWYSSARRTITQIAIPRIVSST